MLKTHLKIRDFPEFLKRVKFAFSIYGGVIDELENFLWNWYSGNR